MRYLLLTLVFAAASCGGTSTPKSATQAPADAASGATVDAGKADAAPTDIAQNADGAVADGAPADVSHCPVDMPTCATSCGSEVLVEAVCGATAWSCPAGSIDAATCPPDTCWGKPPADTVCAKGQWVCKPGWVQFSAAAPCVEATCEVLQAALLAGIDSLTVNHQLCGKDEDCVIVASSTACQGTCGVALSKSQAQAFKDGIAALDQKLCKDTNFATKCQYVAPKCAAPAPACVNTQCVYSKAAP